MVITHDNDHNPFVKININMQLHAVLQQYFVTITKQRNKNSMYIYRQTTTNLSLVLYRV